MHPDLFGRPELLHRHREQNERDPDYDGDYDEDYEEMRVEILIP